MHRAFNPLLFLLASTPNAEKSMDMLLSMLQITTESVKNIKKGIETFQASMTAMSQNLNQSGPSPAQPGQSSQAEEPLGKPEFASEPATTPESATGHQAGENPVS